MPNDAALFLSSDIRSMCQVLIWLIERPQASETDLSGVVRVIRSGWISEKSRRLLDTNVDSRFGESQNVFQTSAKAPE